MDPELLGCLPLGVTCCKELIYLVRVDFRRGAHATLVGRVRRRAPLRLAIHPAIRQIERGFDLPRHPFA